MDRELKPLELHITKLDLQPGDILAVKVGEKLTDARFDLLAKRLKKFKPKGIEVLLISPEIELEIIHSEQDK